MRKSVLTGIFLLVLFCIRTAKGKVKICKSSADCGSNAICQRKTGGCQCKRDYIGDGQRCEHLPKTLTNIVQGRPTEQSSTESANTKAPFAVDGNYHKCSQTKWSADPWWRVDLGKSVWVEKVLIASKEGLSNVEIRIGDKQDTNNPLCRQGLEVPKEPWLYSCAEPMLGRFVYIRLEGKGTLKLCEVGIYVNCETKNLLWKYLGPTSQGRFLLKGAFVRSEIRLYNNKEYTYLNVPKRGGTWYFLKEDLIIDAPPMKGSLRYNDKVIIPVKWSAGNNNNLIATCGGKTDDYYLNATFISSHKGKYLVKSVYKPIGGKDRSQREEKFNCSLNDLRLSVAEVCRLDTICPVFSRCDTTYISPSFPPASYYCMCNPGYEPSIRRPGNFILPHEKCVKQKPREPFIQHSKQNLALGMKTVASSTDNFNGCKEKNCKEVPAFARLAVDGSLGNCFRSLTEYKPWLIVHFEEYHPIALIHVNVGKPAPERLKVFVGNTKATPYRFALCAIVRTDLALWSAACKNDQQNYMWGNAVKLQTDAEVLFLCEVEVYEETYANIALKHQTLDAESTGKDSPTTDGILKGGPCFLRTRNPYWWIKFGSTVRVAVVFLMHAEDSYSSSKGIKIKVGRKIEVGHVYTLCARVPGYNSASNYFRCKQTLEASTVYIEMNDQNERISLCEVEIFQTKIINLAARRPVQDVLGKSKRSHGKPEIGCDQQIDKAFFVRAKTGPWWSVDLLATSEIHLIRIITDVGYKPADLMGLKIIVGSSKLIWTAKPPPGKLVATLNHPTNARVQNITLPKSTKGRVITLQLPAGQERELRFREVEVYNGELLDANECTIPDVCPPNFQCKNLPQTYSCECKGGFKYEIKGKGPHKKCVDRDECSVGSSCPLAHSYCKNTFGSYQCLCSSGYEEVYDSKKRLVKCKDVDECKNSSLFNCPELTRCVNLPGGFTCACATGYEPAVSGKTQGLDIKCKDEDECEKRTYRCHGNATCSNTKGSYECICFSGLKGDGRTHCSDLDPCTEDKKCKLEHQTCREIKGTHLCDCSEGFYHGFRKCEDKNECESDPNICGSNSVCTNNVGSYKCSCKPGFESASDDGKACTDINECNIHEVCGDVAECENMMGTYKCNCPDGLAFDVKNKTCFDVDECEDPDRWCGPNTQCFNKHASYSCACRTGFQSDNKKLNCTDIDECAEKELYDCDRHADCVNTHGGYDCKCKQGYKKTGSICELTCSEECSENEVCSNGRCYCKPGYTLGPYRQCYEKSFLLGLGSGISLHASVMLLAAGLLGCLALA